MSTRPIEKIIAKLDGTKRSGESGKQWVACCPAHDDSHQSLAVRELHSGVVLLKCYAGCGIAEVVASLGLSQRDLYPSEDRPDLIPTVAVLAWHKRLPESFLVDVCKLRDDGDKKGVGIPYKVPGQKAIWKIRTALVAKEGSKWPVGTPIETYGQWLLAEFLQKGNHLCLVEGESDCWTLWFHGFPALGIPGASAAKALRADQVKDFTRITAWQEPGPGGEQFITGITKRLAEFGWQGEFRVIKGGAIKDPNVLHQRDPEVFAEQFRVMLEEAEAVGLDGLFAKKKTEAKKPTSRVLIPGEAEAAKGSPDPNSPTPEPAWYGLTDLGNSERLVFRHGKDIRHCANWQKWLVWGGQSWIVGADALVMQKAYNTVRSIYLEAAAAESGEKSQRLSEHAVKSEGARPINSMVLLAKHHHKVDIDFEKLDADPWLLNAPNCTVDLRTGQATTHRREHLITKRAATSYNQNADCPNWEKFLLAVFERDEELVSYIQRLLGYCLTGDISTHMLPVFWGGGGNGKGTLLNTILYVLGDSYGSAAGSQLLLAGREQRHPTEIANLYGKRLVVCQETDDGCRLNEPLVKWLTGGDKLQARRMREDFWEFYPTHKIILSTNYRPVVRGTDRGIWRRLRLIPFKVTFSGKGEDRGLSQRLKEEAQGILAWMVRGCLDWQRHGEEVPEAVLVATNEYQQDQDIVQRFLAECCVTGKEDLRCRASALYAAYQEWVEKGNEGHPMSQTKFGRRVGDLGYQKVSNNGTWYTGLKVDSGSPPSTVNGHQSIDDIWESAHSNN